MPLLDKLLISKQTPSNAFIIVNQYVHDTLNKPNYTFAKDNKSRIYSSNDKASIIHQFKTDLANLEAAQREHKLDHLPGIVDDFQRTYHSLCTAYNIVDTESKFSVVESKTDTNGIPSNTQEESKFEISELDVPFRRFRTDREDFHEVSEKKDSIIDNNTAKKDIFLLPKSMLISILSNIGALEQAPKMILTFSLISKKWNALLKDQELWKTFLKRDFNYVKNEHVTASLAEIYCRLASIEKRDKEFFKKIYFNYIACQRSYPALEQNALQGKCNREVRTEIFKQALWLENLKLAKYIHEEKSDELRVIVNINMLNQASSNKEGFEWLHREIGGVIPYQIVSCVAEAGNMSFIKELCKRLSGYEKYILNYAARSGNVELVKWMLDKLILLPPQVINSAVMSGNLFLVKWLLEKRNANAQDNIIFNMETLKFAALAGHLHIVQWMVEKGFNLLEDTLNAAAESGNVLLVQWIMDDKRGEKKIAPTQTTLEKAALSGNLVSVQWLLQADKNLKLDTRVLLEAVISGNLKLVQWIFQQLEKSHVLTNEELEDIGKAAAVKNNLSVLEWLCDEKKLDITKVMFLPNFEVNIPGMRHVKLEAPNPITQAWIMKRRTDGKTICIGYSSYFK